MFYLVILLKVDKRLEVYFYYIILTLDLVVILRIKNSKKLAYDFEIVAEIKPEL